MRCRWYYILPLSPVFLEALWDIISPNLCYHGNGKSSNTRRLSSTKQDFIVDYNKVYYFLLTTSLPSVK
jgi:hypothetical protein